MKTLTETQAKDLYVSLTRSIDPKDTFLQILFETGARVSEAVIMTREDLTGDILTVRPLKNSLPRQVQISKGLAAKLRKFPDRWSKAIAETVRRDSIRRSLTRHFHARTEELLGQRLNIHILRHTAFTRLYVATKDLLMVKNWAGHKSINSTMAYMHADQKREADKTQNDLLKTLVG